MRRLFALVSLTLSAFAVGVGVAAQAGAGGGGGCQEMTEGSGDAVELVGFCFTPSVLRVMPGTEVSWTNEDQVDHVVTGTGWGLDANLGAGDSGTHRFDEAGTYPYTCYLHPGMNGVVLVGDEASASLRSVSDDQDGMAGVALDSSAPIARTGGDASPIGAGAIGALAGLAGGVVGSHLWSRRLSG